MQSLTQKTTNLSGIIADLIYLNKLPTINAITEPSASYYLSVFRNIYTTLKTLTIDIQSDLEVVALAKSINSSVKLFIRFNATDFAAGDITAIFTAYSYKIDGIWISNFDVNTRTVQNEMLGEIRENGGLVAFSCADLNNLISADPTPVAISSIDYLVVNNCYQQDNVFQGASNFFYNMLMITAVCTKYQLTNAMLTMSSNSDSEYNNFMSNCNATNRNNFLNSALFFGCNSYSTASTADYYASGDSTLNMIPQNYQLIVPNQNGDVFKAVGVKIVEDTVTQKQIYITDTDTSSINFVV